MIPPEGEIVDLNTTEKSIWASRLVDCHGDATREEVKDAPVEVSDRKEARPKRGSAEEWEGMVAEAGSAEADAVKEVPLAELGNDKTRARAKGKAVSNDR